MSKQTNYFNEGKTVKELIYNAKNEFPTNPAFKYKVNKVIQTVNYTEFVDQSEALGTWLINNVEDKALIGIIGENSYYWYSLYFAAVATGHIGVPIDKGLTGVEVRNCLERVSLAILFYDQKHEAIIREMEPDFPNTRFINMDGADSKFAELVSEGKKLLEEQGIEGYNAHAPKSEDIAVYLFTSGTTDQSKIVVLNHGNLAANSSDMCHIDLFHYNAVNMALLPLHHSFGLGGLTVFLAIGGCNVFCDGLKYIQKNLSEYGVTVFVGVPLLVENIYKKVQIQIDKQGKRQTFETGLKISNFLRKFGIDIRRKLFKDIIAGIGGDLKLIICGASALDPVVAKGMNDMGILTVQGYGLTETSPVLCDERPTHLRSGSVGIPLRSVTVKVKNPDEDGVGEILVKGPNVMVGYLNAPEENARVFEEDGFFNTGDLGKVDKDGFVWLCGRKKNVIVMKNGKNVFPEEIEGLIEKLEYIDESLVYNEMAHHEVVLWVKAVYNKSWLEEKGMTVEQLEEKFKADLDAINDTLPSYKRINNFRLTDEPMIKTTTAKVKRHEELAKDKKQN